MSVLIANYYRIDWDPATTITALTRTTSYRLFCLFSLIFFYFIRIIEPTRTVGFSYEKIPIASC